MSTFLKRTVLMFAAAALIFPFLAGESFAAKKTKDQQRKEMRAMRDKALSKLYRLEPGSKKAIAGAAGYGVFDLFSLKILVTGSTNGRGIVVDNASRKETFMKMYRVSAGLGVGAKDFRWVFVFHSKSALNDFVNKGWEFGAEAGAAAKNKKKGGALGNAVSVGPDISVYQLTEKGLALEADIGGSKYWKDKDLN
jgi:lipid-binding SYLF domain-containing protein